MSWLPRYSTLLSISVVALLAQIAASAPVFSVALQDSTVPVNGVGEVEVTIAGLGDAISLVGYEFQIAPLAGASSQLQFLEESEAFLADPDYVFSGHSSAVGDGLPSSVGTVSSSILPGDTFVGGDSTDDFSDVAISGTKLLLKLMVKHIAGPVDPLTADGHAFSISLVPAAGDSSEFSNGTANTGFINSQLAGFTFESESGRVTALIPEPAGTLILLQLTLAGSMARRVRCCGNVAHKQPRRQGGPRTPA